MFPYIFPYISSQQIITISTVSICCNYQWKVIKLFGQILVWVLKHEEYEQHEPIKSILSIKAFSSWKWHCILAYTQQRIQRPNSFRPDAPLQTLYGKHNRLTLWPVSVLEGCFTIGKVQGATQCGCYLLSPLFIFPMTFFAKCGILTFGQIIKIINSDFWLKHLWSVESWPRYMNNVNLKCP